MLFIPFRPEEYNSEKPAEVYVLMRKFLETAILKEIEKYLGKNTVDMIHPTSDDLQPYRDELIIETNNLYSCARLISADVYMWVYKSGIDPKMFVAKKLAQLVRLIKSDVEEQPDLFHEYLIESLGLCCRKNAACPFPERDRLVELMVDLQELYYVPEDDSDCPEDTFDRNLCAEEMRSHLRNLNSFIDYEIECEPYILFDDDDFNCFDSVYGPEFGVLMIFNAFFQEYPRTSFEQIFELVGEQMPLGLRIMMDDLVEQAMLEKQRAAQAEYMSLLAKTASLS